MKFPSLVYCALVIASLDLISSSLKYNIDIIIIYNVYLHSLYRYNNNNILYNIIYVSIMYTYTILMYTNV